MKYLGLVTCLFKLCFLENICTYLWHTQHIYKLKTEKNDPLSVKKNFFEE